MTTPKQQREDRRYSMPHGMHGTLPPGASDDLHAWSIYRLVLCVYKFLFYALLLRNLRTLLRLLLLSEKIVLTGLRLKKRHFYDSIEIEISSINAANSKFASKWSRRPSIWFEWEIQLLFWFSIILCSTPLEGGIGWWRSMPCREEIEFRNCLFMFCFAWFWNIIKAVSVVWKKEISFCYVMTWSCRKNIQNVKWTFKWVGYSNV